MSDKHEEKIETRIEPEELSEEELQNVDGGAVFAKYDGIDGESKDGNHDKWIDVLSIDRGK